MGDVHEEKIRLKKVEKSDSNMEAKHHLDHEH